MGLWGRMDHLLSNIFLPSDPGIAPFMAQIALRDQQNMITYRPAGQHLIHQEEGMTYVAFMAEGEADLTITGAKFELTQDNFFKRKSIPVMPLSINLLQLVCQVAT